MKGFKGGKPKSDRLIMYMHAGSGNHGCEAIVNSICRMIKEQVTLISYFGEEDQRYSLPGLCKIKERGALRSTGLHMFCIMATGS